MNLKESKENLYTVFAFVRLGPVCYAHTQRNRKREREKNREARVEPMRISISNIAQAGKRCWL